MNYYHINKSTLTIISGPYPVQATYIKKLTNCGNPECLDLLSFDIVPEVVPGLTDVQKYGPPIIYSDRVEISVIDKTSEELSIELQSKIDMMDRSIRDYIDKVAHWTAGPLVFDKAAKGKPKSLAIKTWVETCWGLYYQRLAALEAGGAWDESYLDFSVIGPCPHSIKDAMLE